MEEKNLPLSSYYEELLKKRIVKFGDVEYCLDAMKNYLLTEDGYLKINRKVFRKPKFYYNFPQKYLIEVEIVDDASKISQLISFTPYGVEAQGLPDYKYESYEVNKLYFDRINVYDNEYIKDYIDFVIASYPFKSEYGLARHVLEKLALINRFPFNLKEYASSGYRTDALNSDLGILRFKKPSELKSYIKDLHEVDQNATDMVFNTLDDKLKYLSDGARKISKFYEFDELEASKDEVFFGKLD